MRVSIATFIIILFTILALLFVKFKPPTVYYVPLSEYYYIFKYCVQWNGYNSTLVKECINYGLTRSYFEVEVKQDSVQINKVCTVYLPSSKIGTSLIDNYYNCLETYYNYTLLLYNPKMQIVKFNYIAYLVAYYKFIPSKEMIYIYLFYDTQPIYVDIVPSNIKTVCKVIRTIYEGISSIFINCTNVREGEIINITDNRGLRISITCS